MFSLPRGANNLIRPWF